MKPRIRHWKGVMMVGVGCLLAACAYPPTVRTVPAEEASSPPPPTQVYFYPLHNQAPEQQDRDRYECYLWAKNQTGFDPSAPQLAPHQRLQVIAEPAPGSDTAAGAVAGAIIGSVISSPHNSAGGAIVGAMTGAMIGATSDAARQQQAANLQEHYDRQSAQDRARIEQQASNYRRAMMACLEGRGYSVR